MVGIVLHEGGSTAHAFGHTLDQAGHGTDFPVPFPTIAISLAHEVLACQSRKLPHLLQIFKGIGESLGTLFFEEVAHCNFLTGLVAYRLQILGGELIPGAIRFHLSIHFGISDTIEYLDEISDTPRVHLPAKLHLHLDLIAFGDCHIAHIIPEAHDFQLAALHRSDG
ncbi:hypothetical protein SDC9_87046 [bioreactor metagenome]|uniref:Uncharacterized protein n=1 Tax=bioreactor metagenome TaxID=1076179 RepID=A0A644ZHS7_9ZZZZ